MATTQIIFTELKLIDREIKKSKAEYRRFLNLADKRIGQINLFIEKRVKPLSLKELLTLKKFSKELVVLKKGCDIAWAKCVRHCNAAEKRLDSAELLLSLKNNER